MQLKRRRYLICGGQREGNRGHKVLILRGMEGTAVPSGDRTMLCRDPSERQPRAPGLRAATVRTSDLTFLSWFPH